MSYDRVGGTPAECELLRQNGFLVSPLEGMSVGEDDGLFHGHWHHPEMPADVCHMSTKEALEWLRKRQEKLRIEPSIGHTSSDFRGQRGFTLFEMLFALVFVLILGGILFGGCMELTGVPQNLRRENAQKQAYNWLHEFRQDMHNPHVSCNRASDERLRSAPTNLGSNLGLVEWEECW